MKESIGNIKKYAAHWVLVFSGSIVVLSIALNQIGFRVDRVMDAWSQAIVLESKLKYELQNCPLPVVMNEAVDLSPIEMRLSILEGMAHEANVK